MEGFKMGFGRVFTPAGRGRWGVSGGLAPVVMALALAACGGGGGGRRGEPSNSTTTGPSTTAGSSSRPVPTRGSVAFTVVGVRLAEPGLRVLVGASGGTIRVVARGLSGGSNGVRICAVDGVSTPPRAGDCVVATDGRGVDIPVSGVSPGVLVQALEGSIGGVVGVAEVTLVYVPEGDRITVVTPPLAPSATPGDCPGEPCRMAFELSPTGPGTFVLEAQGRGGRPQLTLASGVPAGASRVMSMVEGGGRLAIRSSLDGGSDATLILRNLADVELPPLELSLAWPART